MGRGVDGGCGAEERPCRPSRRDSKGFEEERSSRGIDLLAQASKHLSERSPYDVNEDGSSVGVSVGTLPIALANLLNQKDDKKRHKKSHHGGETKKKKSSRQGEKLRAGSIWVERQEYFRRLELPDLETLSDLASLRSLSSRGAFQFHLWSMSRLMYNREKLMRVKRVRMLLVKRLTKILCSQ